MLGYELRLWRKGCGWTQERAAEEFDVSLRTYQMYEKTKGIFPCWPNVPRGSCSCASCSGSLSL